MRFRLEMAKFGSILTKNSHFLISPKKVKPSFFRVQRLDLKRKLANSNAWISRKTEQPSF